MLNTLGHGNKNSDSNLIKIKSEIFFINEE